MNIDDLQLLALHKTFGFLLYELSERERSYADYCLNPILVCVSFLIVIQR
jgi:hypothetical protein